MNTILESIVELVDAGLSTAEISEKLNLQNKRILRTLRRFKKFDYVDVLLQRSYDRYTKSAAQAANKKYEEIFGKNFAEFTRLVTNGYTNKQFEDEFGISIKTVEMLAKRTDTIDILRLNNRILKSVSTTQTYKSKRNVQIDEVISKYETEITKYLHDGYHFKQIRQTLPEKIPIKLLNLVIDRLGLTELRQKNSYETFVANANKISKLGAEKTKGKPAKEILPEIHEFYKKSVEDGKYDGETRRAILKQFGRGHTGNNTWNVLISLYGKLTIAPKAVYGEQNYWFGKEPPKGTGSGINGHIYGFGQKIIFRSSLEMLIYIYLIDNNITFSLSKHCIKYEHNGKISNYRPDIVINEKIFEIKPTVKINWPLNIAKHSALVEYCASYNLKCEYITEFTYPIEHIEYEYVEKLIAEEKIIITEKQLTRLKNYFDKCHKKLKSVKSKT